MSLRRGWRTWLVGTVLVTRSLVHAQTPAIDDTMPESNLPGLKAILATALKQAPATVARELDIDQARARKYGADAPRYPNVGGNFSFARNDSASSNNSNNSSTNDGFFYSFGVNQPLYHWGALQHESDKARIGVLIAEKNYKDAYRALAVTLRKAYLDLIVKKAEIEQLRYVRKLRESELDLIKEKFKDGRASGGEVTGKQLEIQDFVLRLHYTEVELGGLRRAFGRLAGVPDPTEESIPVEVPAPVFKEDVARDLLVAMVRNGARSTFQAEMAEMRIRQADLDYRIARVRLLPKFNAGASYSLDNTTNATSSSVTQEAITRQTFSVGANWNIFDGFATRGAKLEALTNKRKLERELENLTEASLDAAQSLFDRLPLDAEGVKMADLRRDMQKGLIVKYQGEFELGNISKNTIAQSEAALKTNEYNAAAARAQFLARWTEFVSLVSVDPVLSNIPARYDREKR